MQHHLLRFDGSLLARGFWVYFWRVEDRSKTIYYVGRTGDNSSINASSPFNRVGMHLDLRRTAQANTLLRHIVRSGLDPVSSVYEMHAVGPIFPEQGDWEGHRNYRDATGALEKALADHLRSYGLEVVGSHHSRLAVDQLLLKQVTRLLDPILTDITATGRHSSHLAK